MTGTLQHAPTESNRPSADPEGPSSRVGSTLGGKYLLHRLLGEGGMGAVYEAENVVTQRRVAVKVMLAQGASGGDAGERFLREARAAARVEHPNIVGVLDAGQSADGTRFIVQELLHGTGLRAVLRERAALPCDEALALLTPVMEALAAAHRAGVVHRDVKPENIFLCDGASGQRVPKLIDFGIARLRDGDALVTRTGALMGTPGYMSPEQARGLKDIDARTDVWAIAVVLREALTGERPFQGDNYNALLASILTDTIAPTQRVAPRAPAAVCAAIDRALSRDIAQRYADVGALLDALRATPSPSPPPRARRPWAALAVAAVALAGLAALAWGRREPARVVVATPVPPPAPSVTAITPPAPSVMLPAPPAPSVTPPAPSVAPPAPSVAPPARGVHTRVVAHPSRRPEAAPSTDPAPSPAPSATLIRDMNGQ